MKKFFIVLFSSVQCWTATFNITDLSMDCDGYELEKYFKDAQKIEQGAWKEEAKIIYYKYSKQ